MQKRKKNYFLILNSNNFYYCSVLEEIIENQLVVMLLECDRIKVDCSYLPQCCDLIGARFMPKCSYLIRASNITFNILSELFILIKNITQKSFNWMHTTILTVQVCVLNRHLHNLAALWKTIAVNCFTFYLKIPWNR